MTSIDYTQLPKQERLNLCKQALRVAETNHYNAYLNSLTNPENDSNVAHFENIVIKLRAEIDSLESQGESS